MATWWRIYYGNGTVFTSEDGTPWDAPRVDVQLIAFQTESAGCELLSGYDYYYFESERRDFYHADMWTIHDHLIRAKYPLIFFGRMITNEEFKVITERALAEIPEKKTAWRRGERR